MVLHEYGSFSLLPEQVEERTQGDAAEIS